MKYLCINCGYVYDPVEGDSMNSIPPETSFEGIPSEWVCPICYATKDQFDPLD